MLSPRTTEGARFVELAERHAADFAATAAEHDRDASFPFEHVEAMKQSGAIGATVPADLGGIGVASVHDLAVGLSRLGQGDGSITIGLCMHFMAGWMLARRWQVLRERGQPGGPDAALKEMAAGKLVMAILNSESGSDNRHPFAEAKPVEGGYLLNGKKSFATLSPAATTASIRVRLDDGNGGYQTASATVPIDAPGFESLHNWDALGMRASGSHDVVLRDVFVPKEALSTPVRWGRLEQPGLVGSVAAATCLAAPFLGIAEAAHQAAIDTVAVRGKQPGPTPLREWGPAQSAVAESEVELSAMRGALDRATAMIDALFAARFPADPPEAELHALMKECQAAKLIVNKGAVSVVDRALAISGGSGYLAKSPLSRLYRDVRAGGFMSPFGELEAREYIARVALGLPPEG
jgi:alkylation response protein AidB-like acyl-CoA dehydrogenase